MAHEPEMGASKKGESSVSRRTFLRRMAILGFAVPLVTSFTLDAAYASPTGDSETGNDQDYFFGNQYHGNMTLGNQFGPNDFEYQTFPNQYFPNQFPTASNT